VARHFGFLLETIGYLKHLTRQKPFRLHEKFRKMLFSLTVDPDRLEEFSKMQAPVTVASQLAASIAETFAVSRFEGDRLGAEVLAKRYTSVWVRVWRTAIARVCGNFSVRVASWGEVLVKLDRSDCTVRGSAAAAIEP
jgi:hypothetical protein